MLVNVLIVGRESVMREIEMNFMENMEIFLKIFQGISILLEESGGE
jgi:hypothetical protein